jgi:hypothetical protein
MPHRTRFLGPILAAMLIAVVAVVVRAGGAPEKTGLARTIAGTPSHPLTPAEIAKLASLRLPARPPYPGPGLVGIQPGAALGNAAPAPLGPKPTSFGTVRLGTAPDLATRAAIKRLQQERSMPAAVDPPGPVPPDPANQPLSTIERGAAGLSAAEAAKAAAAGKPNAPPATTNSGRSAP